MRISDWSSDVCSSDLRTDGIAASGDLPESMGFGIFRDAVSLFAVAREWRPTLNTPPGITESTPRRAATALRHAGSCLEHEGILDLVGQLAPYAFGLQILGNGLDWE